MSKLTSVATTGHTLSVMAMEEAARLGSRTADIDHLFLALVVNEQLAGQVLRSFGITLDSARDAVAAQHEEQLASLGIHAASPAPGRVTPLTGEGYEWGPQALEIITHAAEGKKRGDAAAVLRDLLSEPSGLIDGILRRLGTSPATVRARLDETEHYPARAQYTFGPEALSGTAESFAPASVAEVWALLSDPERMPEWELTVGRGEGLPTTIEVGSSWIAHRPKTFQDGRPQKIKPGFESMEIELLAREEEHLIEWRFRWPRAAKANARRVRIVLERSAGGTQLHTRVMWERSPARARRRVPRMKLWLFRPLHRMALWMQLMQLGASISRAFR